MKVPLVRLGIPPLPKPNAKALQQRDHNHAHLEHCEPFPRAVHRPVRERDECDVVVHEIQTCSGSTSVVERRESDILELQLSRRDEPALGPEGLGEREVTRVAVDGPRREVDGGTGWEVASSRQRHRATGTLQLGVTYSDPIVTG